MKKSKAKKIIIVGAPNVGKSSLFNRLSRNYALVSNYPGTTVELFSGWINLAGQNYELIDTPGMYSLLALSDDEKVSRRALLESKPDLVIHVGSASNLENTLFLTLQLIEAGLPVVLVLNMIDEAEQKQISLDIAKLKRLLNIEIIPTALVAGRGVSAIKQAIKHYRYNQPLERLVDFGNSIEDQLVKIEKKLSSKNTIALRALALLLLEADCEIDQFVLSDNKDALTQQLDAARQECKGFLPQPLDYTINLILRQTARQFARKVMQVKEVKHKNFSQKISRLLFQPAFGLIAAGLFIYFGLYQIVGRFAAGVIVDFLEHNIFQTIINPFFVKNVTRFLPDPALNALFIGEYGIFTLALRYALAIVLPIVGVFFFVFSLAEDSGYLPRLAALFDSLFKKIGLSGKAVIPMVLGLGCDTMAVTAARILPTQREKIIATFLLSLAVPCSAQLGVMLAVLAKYPRALSVWFFSITFIFSVSGFLLNKLLKGKRASFYIELPPLRLPRVSNVLIKTSARLKWYFQEIIPIFIFASILIWFGQRLGIFEFFLQVMVVLLKGLGLPSELAKVFLFGFFRRDYGAAGLYDLDKLGLLNFRQVVVVAVTLTLFVPCLAQFLVNIKERGVKVGLAIAGAVLFLAYGVGVILNQALLFLGF